MRKILITLSLLIIINMSYGQTPTPQTNFGTASSCCAANYTIGVSEATNSNNKLPSIQFHASGFQEAFLRLAADNRVFEIGDNQGVGVDFAIRNPGNNLRNVLLSGKGISFFNGGNVGIGTTTPIEKLEVNGNLQASGTIKFGNTGVRTESRSNAGLQGNQGALSGFYETSTPENFPKNASSWWHLIDSRHSNPANNYAMQIAGSFFDQKLYFRKTNNSATEAWKEIVAIDATGKVSLDNDAATLKKSVTIGGYVYGGAIRFNANSAIANTRNLELGNSDNNGIFYPSVVVSAENGNVGIGTNNPENNEGWNKVLDVYGSSHSKIIATTANVQSGIWSHSSGYYNSPAGGILGTKTNHPLSIITNGTNKLLITNDGNVGIGTINPSKNLTIAKNNSSTLRLETTNSPTAYFTDFTSNYDAAERFSIQTGVSKIFGNKAVLNNGYSQTFLNDYYDLVFTTGVTSPTMDNIRMIINNLGNVGIGTTKIPTDFKLAVAGNIIAERVVVKLQTNWPDYVFTPSYHRETLSEVEKYINQNHHLPNIPSAKEVSENGIDIGAMNTKMMEKIEELTLYLIEQNKKIEALEKKNLYLENTINNIKK